MAKDFPVELRIDKVCAKCGKMNVVALSKLDSRPVCEKCNEPLSITDADIASAAAMLKFAESTNTPVDVG